MSLSLMSEVWPLDLPLGKKFVLLAICDSGHDDGEIFLCVETLAYKCGMSVRTVQQHLADLEVDGFITRQERPGRSSIFTVYPMMLRAAPRHPLYERRRQIRDKYTPAKSSGVPITPEKSAGVASTPAGLAPAPAEFAPAPADSAPITVLEPSPNGSRKKTPRERGYLTASDLHNMCGVDKQVAQDWLTARKAKLTKTALDAIQREADKAQLALAAVIQICAERGWRGFKADWLQNNKTTTGGTIHDQRRATIAGLTGGAAGDGRIIDAPTD